MDLEDAYCQASGTSKDTWLRRHMEGYLKTSYDDFKEEHQASLKIFQSWTRIGISQQAQSSKGESFAASILTKEPEAKRLFFMYRNTPQADSDPNLHQHIGSAQLILAGGILSGDYYNCARDRPTYGTLHFEKETSRSHRSNCTHWTETKHHQIDVNIANKIPTRNFTQRQTERAI